MFAWVLVGKKGPDRVMDDGEPLVPLTSSSSSYQLMAGWEPERPPIKRGSSTPAQT